MSCAYKKHHRHSLSCETTNHVNKRTLIDWTLFVDLEPDIQLACLVRTAPVESFNSEQIILVSRIPHGLHGLEEKIVELLFLVSPKKY